MVKTIMLTFVLSQIDTSMNREKVITLIAVFTTSKDILNYDIRIYHDLNIYGDDADELLEKYAKEFNVDISFFKFTDYFPEEGDILISTLIRILSLKQRTKYKELKISDLIHAAETGILDLDN